MLETKRFPLKIRIYAVYLAALWTIFIAVVFALDLKRSKDEALNRAYTYTKVGFEKDIIYRRWVSEHGGVYVKADSTTPPNPYLSHIPDRDIFIDSSLSFTLMNPAYMTRQVYELESKDSEVRGHITSLNLLRPENVADIWEIEALTAFENGAEEYYGVSQIDGKDYFRFMKPFLTEETCLKCHAHQGYLVNDIRGGISVSYPMSSINTILIKGAHYQHIIFAVLWLMGLVIIFISWKKISKSASKQMKAEEALLSLNEELEQRIEIKSRELNKWQQDWGNIFNNLGTPAQLIDKDHIIKYVNDETLKVFKLKREDLIGKKCHVLFHMRKTPPDSCPLTEAFKENRFSREEMFIELLKKRFIVACSPIFDANGEIEYFMHIMTDISERETAQNALKESEERYKELVEKAGIAVLIDDKEGKFTYYNEKFAALFGFSRDEMKMQSIKSLVHPDDYEMVIRNHNESISGKKKSSRYEFRAVRKDGSSIYLEVDAVGIQEKEQTIGTRSYIWDNSERKKAEKALSHSRDLMRYVIEHNRSAVAVHDKDMKYLYVSQRYLQDYKVKKSDVIGKHHYDVFPDLPQKWRDVHQKALNGEVSNAEDDPYYKEDGSAVWTRWECRPWYESDGSIGGIIVYTEVITDRKLAEEKVKESEANLKSLVENREDSIWSVDKNMDFLTFNSYFAEAYYATYNIKIKKGMNAVNVLSSKLMKLWKLKYEKVLSGESIVFEFSEQFGDNDLYYQVSMNPIIKEDIVTGVSAISLNITERKNIETELDNYRKNLEEIVTERTKELESKNKSLEELNKIFVGREIRMAELKEEIEKLKRG